MKNDCLYPGDAVAPVYQGDDYRDYWLSEILASHGYVIRMIVFSNDARVIAYRCENGDKKEACEFIIPILSSEYEDAYMRKSLYFHSCKLGDILVRYKIDSNGYSYPVWHTACTGRRHIRGFKINVYSLLVDYLSPDK